MKLIIDIPDEEYKTLSKLSEKEKINELSYYERIIAQGTVLPKGDWIINPDTRTMKCSRCGAIENADRWLVEDMNYCHSCGADLRGAEK